MAINIKGNKPTLKLVEAKAKKKGRPKWQPDLEQAAMLASHGLSNEQIATALGVVKSTFYDQQANFSDFSDSIKRGRSKGIAAVANALFEKAMGGDTTAMIFWLKCHAGWRDKGAYVFDPLEDQQANNAEVFLNGLAHALMKSGAALKKQGQEDEPQILIG